MIIIIIGHLLGTLMIPAPVNFADSIPMKAESKSSGVVRDRTDMESMSM